MVRIEVAQRLQTLSPRAMTAVAAAAAEIVMRSAVSDSTASRAEYLRLRSVLDRVWTLVEGSTGPDVWDDADATFCIAQESLRESQNPAIYGASLAVHYAVRTWLTGNGQQAVLSLDQVTKAVPTGLPACLTKALESLESGTDPVQVCKQFRH